MTIEEKIKKKILEKYKSIRAFTQITKIPYSTVDTMLKKGISGTGVKNMQKICSALGISLDALEYNEIVDKVDSIHIGGTFFFGPHATLLSCFEKLDDNDKAQVIGFAKGLLNSEKYNEQLKGDSE